MNKIKKSVATLLALLTITSATAAELTLSPVYTVADLIVTAINLPLATAIVSTASTSNMREIQQEVRDDAFDMLERDSKPSEKLEKIFERMREQNEQLAAKTDRELAITVARAPAI